MSTVPNLETWTVRKPAVRGRGGLVASQHRVASEVGAKVLADGGNAVDAAVATGLAIGCVEPWMSGIGGGGFMLVYQAREQKVYAVDFGMRAPAALDPATYPLVEGQAGDLFGWPGVVEDRNIHGYHSIAVPGHVAGMATALDRFGSLSWQDALGPAIELAEGGMSIDWYASLIINSGARLLRKYDESARAFLPDGLPPVPEWTGEPGRIQLGRLAATLRRLSEAGPRDYYEGEIGRDLIDDLQAGGSTMSLADLAGVEARVTEADCADYRGAKVHVAPGLTAGPTLQRVLTLLEDALAPAAAPGTAAYTAYAAALMTAYAERLETMGDSDETRSPSCTTHLTVVDREGNMVSLTQTLLSLFGSRVVLPRTGVTMNNGIMWFDPRPGRANSIAAGKRPLSNMCPAIVERADGYRFAIGASGGRRIMPAVAQLISFQLDFAMDADAAFHQPRIDVSGTDTVTSDHQLPDEILDGLRSSYAVRPVQHGVYPPLFACPNMVASHEDNDERIGAAFVLSPWAKVAAQGG